MFEVKDVIASGIAVWLSVCAVACGSGANSLPDGAGLPGPTAGGASTGGPGGAFTPGGAGGAPGSGLTTGGAPGTVGVIGGGAAGSIAGGVTGGAAGGTAGGDPSAGGSTGAGAAPGAGGAPIVIGGPADCEGFVIDEGSFTVNPGDNVNYCVRIPLPPGYQDRDLALYGWDWDLQDVTHHFFMEYSPHPFPGPGTAPVPCPEYKWNGTSYDHVPGQSPDGTFSLLGSVNGEGSKILFGAGVGKGSLRLDPDRGKYMVKDGHFRTSHHVINTSDQPVTVGAKFKMCMKDAARTKYLVQSLVCTTTDINVPAATQKEVRATCTAPYDLDLVLVASHAHQHLTKFETRLFDGFQAAATPIYTSTTWDAPLLQTMTPPIHLKAGQGITYSCYYQAPANAPVLFGDGEANEHCASYNGYSLPADHPYEIPKPLFGISLSNALLAVMGDSSCAPNGGPCSPL